MAPKRPVKPKKEDVVEIPKTSTLPDGPRVHFIGGWSSQRSIAALNDITVDRHSGDKVFILPGEFADGDHTLVVRSLTVEGVTESDLAAPRQTTRVEAEAEAAEPAADEVAAPVKADPQVERSVLIKGAIKFEAWIPPVEVKAPTPPPVEEKKETKPAAKPGGKEKKKAVVVEDEAPKEAPVADAPPPVGATPNTWPTIVFRKICFAGPVETKGVHVTFEDCHFQSVGHNQLSVHQYCNVTLTRCTFSLATKSCIYAFPLAVVSATECIFSGADLYAAQKGAAGDAAAASHATASEATARGCSSSVGVFVDNAQAQVTGCKFRHLAIGAMVHDKSASTQIAKSDFDRIFSVGCYLDGAHCVVKGNTIKKCEYYGLRARGKTGAKVLNNDIESKVFIEKGASPLLFGNNCAVRLIDANETGNLYMEPSY